MAKTSSVEKEKRRRKLAARGKYPRVRLRNRCKLCGRPRGYMRKFGLCRICFRKLANEGKLPGVIKSSW